MVGDAACAFIFHEPVTVPQFEFAGTFRQEDEPLSEPHHFQPVNRDIAAFSFLLGYFGHGQAFRLQALRASAVPGIRLVRIIATQHMSVSIRFAHIIEAICFTHSVSRLTIKRRNRRMETKRAPLTGEQRRRDIVRSTVSVNLKRGKITRQPCEVCGTAENVEAHHDDYSKPLQVRWLCRAHHNQHHVEKRGRLCKCGQPRAKSQHCCTACHNARMRAYRNGHADQLNEQRRNHTMSDDQRQRDIARSKVSVYLRRGKIHKSPCPCCGSSDVKARILDYAHPLKSVVWLCAAAHAYSVRTGNLPAIRKAA